VTPEPSPPAGAPPERRRLAGPIAAAAAVAAVIALLVVGLLNKGVDTSIRDALAAGERPPAPELTLPVLVAGDGIGPAGSRVSLAGLRGRTVVVNIWASWCIPCETEAPVLDEVARHYRAAGDDGVVVLGIDVRDLSEDALGFWRKFGLSYPSLRDGSDDAAGKFQTTGVPETYVIDPQGRIAYRQIGEVQRADEMIRLVDDIAAAPAKAPA
jgi:cytochrome c biogenesis protein CcmG/thiol:disulfide interchange protein DsbE